VLCILLLCFDIVIVGVVVDVVDDVDDIVCVDAGVGCMLLPLRKDLITIM